MSHDQEMLSKSSRDGIAIAMRAKYGITLKAATGLLNTEPSSSVIMYAPPLLREMTIRGPR